MQRLNKHFNSYYDGAMHKNVVWTGFVEGNLSSTTFLCCSLGHENVQLVLTGSFDAGIRVYFIDPQHPAEFFNRDSVYCQPDDFQRFTYFARASLEFLYQFGKRPKIIHCHDWPVAAVVRNSSTRVVIRTSQHYNIPHRSDLCLLAMQAPLYKSHYAALGLNAKLAFTCHNFEPQGKNTVEALESCGIQFKAPLHKDDFQDHLAADKINVLKVREPLFAAKLEFDMGRSL